MIPFLGQVIGQYSDTRGPFIAEQARFKQEGAALERLNRLVRLFSLTESQLKKCRIALRVSNGLTINAPEIARIERDIHKTLFLKVVTRQIDIVIPTFRNLMMLLIDDKGYLVKFESNDLEAKKEDAVFFSYSLTVPIDNSRYNFMR